MSDSLPGIWQPVDDTDPRVEYYPPQAWTPVEHSSAVWGAQNSTYHTSAANGSFIFLQFHANGFIFWSHSVPDSKGKWWMRLDGSSWTSFNTNTNASDTAVIKFFQQLQLTDSDHEFIAWFEPGAAGESAFIDTFSLQWFPGPVVRGLTSTGVNASNVPLEAAVVDNTDLKTTYSSGWSNMQGVQYYKQSASVTTTPGSWFTFEFEGTGVWYYADTDTGHARASASINGSDPTVIETTSAGPLSRRLLWKKDGLSPGKYILNVTHVGFQGELLTVDFFRVLQVDSTNVSSTANPQSVDDKSSSKTGLGHGAIAGIAIVCVALLLSAIAFGVWYRRRKSSRSGKAGPTELNLLLAETADEEVRPVSTAHPAIQPWRDSESEQNVTPDPAKSQRELLRDHHSSAVASSLSVPSRSGADLNSRQGFTLPISEDLLQTTAEQSIVARSLPVSPRTATVAERASSPPPPYIQDP